MKRNSALRATIKLLAFLALIVAGGLTWAYATGRLDEQDPLSAYLVSTVSKGTVEETVLATGIVKPQNLVAVGAQASGRITALHVSLGQTIKAGDLVAEIDSVSQQNALLEAEAAKAKTEAELVEKEAELVLARQTLKREQSLANMKISATSDLDSAVAGEKTILAQMDSLRAQIKSAEVAVAAAEVDLGYTKIKAPSDGTVLAIVSQEGQTVNAVQSAPTIIVLGDLNTMAVRTEISEADIVRIQAGLPVTFSVLGAPDVTYSAKLETIEPAPESIVDDSSLPDSSSSSTTSTSAIYYIGVFHVPNPEGKLRTYMTADVRIQLGLAENVLTVPSAALQSRDADGRYTVLVATTDGAIEQRKVEIGLNDKITAEVRSGLDEGDRVISGQKAAGTASQTSTRGGPPPMGL
ncbi:efflux RND transporter periplasmic adaptor subunit [Roseibium suaedae]|uniref:Membrane fusion protein, macrolide-specific efflux system n=1 Tax=Roseibium suaedae TaxID=735517 RepID=A0A1M7IAW5_9HYPH|nr:efflux RND transporter periplasmic adaptor subunit [Roseibium suaedae]SHM37587.1 membrane fusion protein, macrolide-specific efflux system [Roseibium suaedae]